MPWVASALLAVELLAAGALVLGPSDGSAGVPAAPQLGAKPDETDPEEAAALLLAEAEEHASEGHYKRARRTYEELAERYPATRAGAVGERRSQPSAFLGAADVVRHGPGPNRVDVVLMGDGYTLGHQDAFEELAEDIPPLFERVEPFREYWSYFNFVRAQLVSADDGVDGFGREFDTALDGRTLDTIAGHVAVSASRVRAMLDELEHHDGLAIVFVKQGVLGTGGSGVATIGGRDARTTVHEFGHSFARLGDEYTNQTHQRGAVGVRPNVSNVEDEEQVPWAHFLAARVRGVGVYEGAAGQVRDAWRPTASGCIMMDGERFCPVCREALLLRIYELVDPIESVEPAAPGVELVAPRVLKDDPLVFRVRVMQPATHHLSSTWWVLPDAHALRDRSGPARQRYGEATTYADRRARGPLPSISAEPWREVRFDRQGLHEVELAPGDLEPGLYQVVCRVRDDAEPRGERTPWILKDEDDLLASQRVWWVEVPPEED